MAQGIAAATGSSLELELAVVQGQVRGHRLRVQGTARCAHKGSGL